MQSQDLEEIKAALWEQAFLGCSRVSWGMAMVSAIRRRKGQLQVRLRGWNRWHDAQSVTILRPALCPTGGCDLLDDPSAPPGFYISSDCAQRERDGVSLVTDDADQARLGRFP